MHVGKRRAIIGDWVGEGATTVGHAHRIVDEHPIEREQVDPALQIFPFGNRIGVTNSGHIVIVHELLLSQRWTSLLENRARAALAEATAELRAVQGQVVAEDVEPRSILLTPDTSTSCSLTISRKSFAIAMPRNVSGQDNDLAATLLFSMRQCASTISSR